MELGDSQQYQLLAENLRTQGRFTWNETPVTFRLPGYPLLLALLGNNVFGMVVVQSLLSAVTILLIGLVGFRLFGQTAGLLAATLFAVDVNSILHAGLVMSESLFIFLVVLALFLFIVNQEGASGFVLGMAAMVRPIGLPAFLPFAVVLMKKRRWHKLGSFLILFVLLPGIWILRNYRLFHRIGWTSNGGYNLFYAGAASVIAEKEHIPIDSARAVLVWEYETEFKGDNPLVISNRMRKIAFRIIAQHPFLFARIYFLGLLRIIFGVKSDDIMMRITTPGMRLAQMNRTITGEGVSGWSKAIAITLAIWELVVNAGVLILSFLSLRCSPRRWWRVFLLLTGSYFIFAASPLADGRLRLPAMPFIYLSAANVLTASGRQKTENG